MALQKEWNREAEAIESVFKSGGWCPLCFSQTRPREMHHIAGRHNSDLTISICSRCHGLLTSKQSKWPKDWTRAEKSPKERIIYIKMGLQDINDLAEQEIKWLEWEVADGRSLDMDGLQMPSDAFTEPKGGTKFRTRKKEPYEYRHRVMVLDTETSTDHLQNLLFGSFQIYDHDELVIDSYFLERTSKKWITRIWWNIHNSIIFH